MIDPTAEILNYSMGFLLVLARVSAIMVLLPGLGEAAPPPTVRIGLSLAITLLLLPGLEATLPGVPDSGLRAAGMIAGEVVAGLWFGWLVRVVVQSLAVAAQYIALLLGLSSVLQPNADLGPQTSALARLAELATPLIVLSTGLYQMSLLAVTEFYVLTPPGSMLPAAPSAAAAVAASSEALLLAIRLASPFLVVAIVWNVAMGLVARLVPRIQIYFAAMPGQILGGLFLLASLSGAILMAWQEAITAALRDLPAIR